MDPPRTVAARSHREVAWRLGVAVVALSFAAPFFKLAAAPPLLASAIRLAIASVLLAWPAWRAWRRGGLSPAATRAAALAGIFYGVHFGAWVTSLGLTSVAASVTLVTATPVMLGVVAIATGRDRPTSRHWLSIVLALVGVVIIGGHDFGLSGDALLGDALALIGAAAMAAYFLSARSVMASADPWGFSFVACSVGAVVLAAGVLLSPGELAPPPVASLGWLLLAALVPQILGHGLMTRALRDARPTVVGMATVGEPVGATLLAWLFLGETITPVIALGCAITATAVALAATARE